MIKTGELKSDSRSDFDYTKKAEFVETDGFYVASKEDKNKLKNPKKLEKQ